MSQHRSLDGEVSGLVAELNEIDPGGRLGEQVDPGSRESQQLLVAFLAQIEDGGQRNLYRSKARRCRRRFGLGFAAAALAAFAVLLVISLKSDEATLGVGSAQAALRDLSLASKAAEQREPRLREGQYYYRRQIGYGGRESWIALNGSGGYRSPRIFDGRLQLTDSDFGRVSIGQDYQLSYREFLELPRDPDYLYDLFAGEAELRVTSGISEFEAEQIRGENESTPPNLRMFSTVQDIFTQFPVPPDLRVALFDVMARIGGIRLLGDVENEVGQSGIGIGMYRGVDGPNDPDAPIAVDGTPVTSREDLIFDQRTGEFIGYRSGNPGSQQGAAIVETGIVGRVGQRP